MTDEDLPPLSVFMGSVIRVAMQFTEGDKTFRIFNQGGFYESSTPEWSEDLPIGTYWLQILVSGLNLRDSDRKPWNSRISFDKGIPIVELMRP